MATSKKTAVLSKTKKNKINKAKAAYKIQQVDLIENHIHDQFEASAASTRVENDRPYPWHAMSVDDSFVVPAATKEQLYRVQAAVSGTTSKRAELHGEVFTTRMVKNGVRVYRVM